jgi:ribose 5-phosphate isomerase B
MKIAVGSDHAGFHYKEMIKRFLEEKGHHVKDFGTHSDDPVDYPVFIRPVAEAVARGEYEKGIVLGGSGNGEAMVANRVKGIRCALCWNRKSARLSRAHNDANLLSLGARMLSEAEALSIVGVWLETPFDEGRHVPRIRQIDAGPPQGHDAAGGEGSVPQEEEAEARDAARHDIYDVTISFGYILYSEGKNILEFRVDPGLKKPTVIHIPSESRWEEEMPAWVGGRRGEILDRLKSKTAHLKCEWEEY